MTIDLTGDLSIERVTGALALFCSPADRAAVLSVCEDLLGADGGLMLCADGVPASCAIARDRLQRQPVRTDFVLLFRRDELRLCKLTARGELGSDSVALVVSELTRRVGARTELQRACLAGLASPRVLDAFAGWGMDAFALVGEGASVDCVEQQPALCALLRDARRRVPAGYAERLLVRCGDAQETLRNLARAAYDVIYLDPMFVPRKKGGLPNKRLQFLAELCETAAPDSVALSELVELARLKAGKQVVLKRRKRDALLGDQKTIRQVVGASVRYDIYAPSTNVPASS